MLGVGVERLSGRLDQLSQRVGRLSEQLAAETATTRLARWASRHPPQSSFVRQIGEGNTGSVHEATCSSRQLGARVAVKRVDWGSHEERRQVAKRIATEISVLQTLQHPLLPQLHQVYSTGDEICLEMTLCSRGTLWHERQQQGGTLPLEQVRQYAAELVCVLSHLHEHGIIYVDLKPENVLLQDCGHIMLCDMDMVHTLEEIRTLGQLQAVGGGNGNSFWGTLDSTAPEVALYGASAYSPASDWWSLGVLMYELLLGLVPWDGSDYDSVMQQVRSADVLWPPQGVLDPEAEDVIRALLHADPESRLGSGGAHELMRHPFFASINWSSMAADVVRDQQLHEAIRAAAAAREKQLQA